MKKISIDLANSISRDRNEPDKVYLNRAQIVIDQFPFAMRQVLIRFSPGPSLDFSIFDMDRLALEYLKMRGVKLPNAVSKLANAKTPVKCDFVVPKSLMNASLKKKLIRPKRPGR
jgi:hypothetical protein